MREAALGRAKGYPYRIERRSFLYVDGTAQPATRLRRSGRTPVIAFGSNRSADQLARKYHGWPKGTEILVTLAWLSGHDVVYSAHFARYGAVPAMLFPAAGVTVEVSVAWLTEPQLVRMHQTEGASNYRFVMRGGIDLRLEDDTAVERAGLYVGRHGAMSDAGRPVPMAEVAADGRDTAGFAQVAAQGLARDRLAPEAPLDDFILQNIACPVTRTERGRRLRRDAIPIDEHKPIAPSGVAGASRSSRP